MKILITGANRGIGASLVTLASEQGHEIIALGRDLTALKQQYANNPKVSCDQLDVCDTAQWRKVIERHTPFDVLINVAGVLFSGVTGELKVEEVSAMLDVNVKGTIFGTNAAAASMKQQESGHIINIGSTAALFPTPGTPVYAASKFAVRGFSLAAAGDLKPYGISVSLMNPCAVKTDMLEQQRGDKNAALTFSGKRALTSEEVAQAILGPVLHHKPLEYFLPKSDGWLGKLSNVWPRLFLQLAKKARTQGEKNFHSDKF
ncbi:SDR family oxidoreductase [Suttonella sp. R2A3]|uniref:SDR family NAD(P)-dependent oxidoreductase n=1 Tax=Suttonella sp. R2A3 TaxID=2908648 RepID=UPI001F3FF910|nr:SDR family oxidoreductase [Suttonella sp. R2A3]UJF25273.1 SDR family oxidoreductase [Suttonella sp. R2A3]